MKPNPRNSNGHRWRQLRKRVFAAYDVCHLCHQAVDKSLRTPHPMSGEIDHRVPISLGGDPYDWENVDLAHRSCNLRKSDGRNTPKQSASAPCPTSQNW